VIANGGKEKLFTGRDWGYLVLLYIFLTVIRAFLFASVYPLTSRIGLKVCYSGLSFGTKTFVLSLLLS
jgi:hypothetical protein